MGEKQTLYSRTKMCKFQLFGVCRYGDKCNYAHSLADMKQLPDFERTSFCKAFLRDGFCPNEKGGLCPYAHKVEELRASPAPRQRLCLFYHGPNASCIYGKYCRYVHEVSPEFLELHGLSEIPSTQEELEKLNLRIQELEEKMQPASSRQRQGGKTISSQRQSGAGNWRGGANARSGRSSGGSSTSQSSRSSYASSQSVGSLDFGGGGLFYDQAQVLSAASRPEPELVCSPATDEIEYHSDEVDSLLEKERVLCQETATGLAGEESAPSSGAVANRKNTVENDSSKTSLQQKQISVDKRKEQASKVLSQLLSEPAEPENMRRIKTLLDVMQSYDDEMERAGGQDMSSQQEQIQSFPPVSGKMNINNSTESALVALAAETEPGRHRAGIDPPPGLGPFPAPEIPKFESELSSMSSNYSNSDRPARKHGSSRRHNNRSNSKHNVKNQLASALGEVNHGRKKNHSGGLASSALPPAPGAAAVPDRLYMPTSVASAYPPSTGVFHNPHTVVPPPPPPSVVPQLVRARPANPPPGLDAEVGNSGETLMNSCIQNQIQREGAHTRSPPGLSLSRSPPGFFVSPTTITAAAADDYYGRQLYPHSISISPPCHREPRLVYVESPNQRNDEKAQPMAAHEDQSTALLRSSLQRFSREQEEEEQRRKINRTTTIAGGVEWEQQHNFNYCSDSTMSDRSDR